MSSHNYKCKYYSHNDFTTTTTANILMTSRVESRVEKKSVEKPQNTMSKVNDKMREVDR